MHGSVLDWFKTCIVPAEITGKRMIEVGSMDVNGSARPLFTAHAPREYIGVDFRAGAGVDRVCNAERLVAEFGVESFDVVMSTEMLEHTPDWKTAVYNLKQVVAKDGLLFVTTRSPGFEYHGYPHDYWRYTKQDFIIIFQDMLIESLVEDPFKPGIFIKARKPKDFRLADLSSVEVGKAPPNPAAPPPHPQRPHVQGRRART